MGSRSRGAGSCCSGRPEVKCCFGLASEQRSPPEGPLAQSWRHQAPASFWAGSCPKVSHGLGRDSSQAALPIYFSLGGHLGPALLEKRPDFTGGGWVGGWWEANAGSSPSPASTGWEEEGQPHSWLGPLSASPSQYCEVTLLTEAQVTCTVTAGSSSPPSEPRLDA